MPQKKAKRKKTKKTKAPEPYCCVWANYLLDKAREGFRTGVRILHILLVFRK